MFSDARLLADFGGLGGVKVRNTFLDFPDLSDDDIPCDFVRHVSEPTAPVARETSSDLASLITVSSRREAFPRQFSEPAAPLPLKMQAPMSTSTASNAENAPSMSLGFPHVCGCYSLPGNSCGEGHAVFGDADSQESVGVTRSDCHVASLGDPMHIKPQNALVNTALEVRPCFCPGCGAPSVSGFRFCPYCRFQLHDFPAFQKVDAMPLAVPVTTPNLLKNLNRMRYVEASRSDVQLALANCAFLNGKV